MKISDFYPQLEEFLMSMKGVEKAFCCDGTPDALITVKCEPDFNLFIREQYKNSIIEGYYMNKLHWNSIKPDKNVPYELVMEMCQRGYKLILHSLPKKTQKEITNN